MGDVHLSYGPWLPTSYLRFRLLGGKRLLEQRMRRRVKRYENFAGTTKSYEYEWQQVPEAKDP